MALIASWWDELQKIWAQMESSIFPLITKVKGQKITSDVCAKQRLKQSLLKLRHRTHRN